MGFDKNKMDEFEKYFNDNYDDIMKMAESRTERTNEGVLILSKDEWDDDIED